MIPRRKDAEVGAQSRPVGTAGENAVVDNAINIRIDVE